ncbi:MAG TPA: hypothetical protein VJT31_30605 [Rugosimonospora sp.]|nr:hypothetical protein [Rugosimonospora sp.]
MRSNTGLAQALDALAVEDVGGLSDGELRAELVALLAAANRLQAQVGRRVLALDRRGLSPGRAAGMVGH